MKRCNRSIQFTLGYYLKSRRFEFENSIEHRWNILLIYQVCCVWNFVSVACFKKNIKISFHLFVFAFIRNKNVKTWIISSVFSKQRQTLWHKTSKTNEMVPTEGRCIYRVHVFQRCYCVKSKTFSHYVLYEREGDTICNWTQELK